MADPQIFLNHFPFHTTYYSPHRHTTLFGILIFDSCFPTTIHPNLPISYRQSTPPKMTQAPKSRSRFVMGSMLQNLASKPKSQKQPSSMSDDIARHTIDDGQVVWGTKSDLDHVDPHIKRDIFKRYNAQCSVKMPFREPPASRNFSQRIIALDAEDDSDDGWPNARFPRARTLSKRVKKSPQSQRRQLVGKAEPTARPSGIEWSPGRGLALMFGSHTDSTSCGTKAEGELALEFRDQSQLTPPRAVNQKSHMVTPGLTLSVSTPSVLGDLPTPEGVITPSPLHLSVARVTRRRVRFVAPRLMEDVAFLLPAWMVPPESPKRTHSGPARRETASGVRLAKCERAGPWQGEDWEMADGESISDNESLIDPFIHRR